MARIRGDGKRSMRNPYPSRSRTLIGAREQVTARTQKQVELNHGLDRHACTVEIVGVVEVGAGLAPRLV